MLSRPEIGTREHIRLWARRPKTPNERYQWDKPPLIAPAGQYAREHYGRGLSLAERCH